MLAAAIDHRIAASRKPFGLTAYASPTFRCASVANASSSLRSLPAYTTCSASPSGRVTVSSSLVTLSVASGRLASNPRTRLQSSSASRCTAGAAGFLLLIQSRERPERYGEPRRFETMPSRPSLQAWRNTMSLGSSICSLSRSAQPGPRLSRPRPISRPMPFCRGARGRNGEAQSSQRQRVQLALLAK
jgi:hypothetical protein